MEPIFSATTQVNNANYSHFYSEINAYFHKKTILRLNIWAIVFILFFGLGELHTQSFPTASFFILLGLVLYDLSYWSRGMYNSACKKIYISWKCGQNIVYAFHFFEDYILVSSSYGYNKMPYNLMYKIIETKTQFIFMDSMAGGYFLDKKDCKDELINYIKQLKSKYSN